MIFLKLTKAKIEAESLRIKQGKTGKEQVKRWTPRLKAAIALAVKQPSKIETLYILHTKHGQPYSSSGFKSNWQRAKEKVNADFTSHDLKAKGISDYEGDKQYFSGHKSKSMMEKYNRTADIVDPKKAKK